MPLSEVIESRSCTIAIWQITESPEALAMLCSKPLQEELRASGLRGRRLLERAAVRALLTAVLPHDTPAITYTADGRPHLDSGQNISISHTRGFAAVMISDRSECGIDIECISERALRISDRFMNDREKVIFGNNAADATLCWSAKETVFKITGTAAWNFRDGITLCGKGSGSLNSQSGNTSMEIHFRFLHDTVMTWAEYGEVRTAQETAQNQEDLHN